MKATPFFVVAIMLLSIYSPEVVAHAQSSQGSNCPPDAMNVALPLATQINQENIPNLNSNASNQQIASNINMVDPVIDNYLGVNIPSLNGNNLHGLSVLVTPFDDFLNASSSVKQSDSGSACNFIAATIVLATDVAVLVGGTFAITLVIALVNVAVQYCDTACILAAVNNAGAFISAHGSIALQAAWTAFYPGWSATNCAILGKCTARTTSTAPEFPYQYLALLSFAILAVAAYLSGWPLKTEVRD